MYYDKDRKELEDIEDYENYYEDDEEDDDTEDSFQDIGQAGNFKGGNFLKGASNFLGNIGKTVTKVAKVVAMLPTPVKIFLVTALAGIIVYLVVDIDIDTSQGTVIRSVTTTVSNLKNKAKTEEISDLEKQKIEKNVTHIQRKNSYLYFTLDNINSAYKNFESENKDSTGGVIKRTYDSLSTIYGTVDLTEGENTSRIVSSDQKVPLYMHLLLTEKYNFNAIKWLKFGHGSNGVELTTANGGLTENKELGIRYPSDGNTSIDTFINLASPYMQTWHIPLSFHSAFIAKSGSAEAASKLTYSIINNASSEIVAHRYDIEKYILNTKYNEYNEYEYRNGFSQVVVVTHEYRPQMEGNNYTITKYIDGTPRAMNIYYLMNDRPGLGTVNGTVYKSTEQIDKKINELYASDLANGIYKYDSSNTDNPFPNLKEGVTSFKAVEYTYTKRDGYNQLYMNLHQVNIGEPKYRRDSNGNILYDEYIKYEYSTTTITDEKQVSKKYVNDRLNEASVEDPKRESIESQTKNITNKYYISSANTFDVKVNNQFIYTKYNENNAINRVNPKSEKQYHITDYYNEVNVTNKLTIDKVKSNYLTGTLASLEKNSGITLKQNNIPATEYKYIKDLVPGTYDKIRTSVVITDIPNLREGSNGSYIKTETTGNEYEAKGTYIIQEGKASENLGTHYIQRIWEDTLTQRSSNTTTYTEEDLVEFNANYNSKLNGTTVETEKLNYQILANRNSTAYNKYKSLAATDSLNKIDFINSNSNIYNEYLVDDAPQNKITGYNREYFKLALEELKELFEDTVDSTGTIPYVYGVSLGLTNLLDKSDTRYINSRAGMFLWPMPDYEYVSYIFGYSKAYSGGTYTNPDYYGLHGGIDMSHEATIVAAADGTVISCNKSFANGENAANSYGNYIKIDHGNGYATIYAHLAEGIKFNVGDVVTRGEEIGVSNTTGSSTGIHLHFGMYEDQNGDGHFSEDELIDPLEFYLVEPANGNTIEYDDLVLDPSLGEQITMPNPYKFVGYPYEAYGMDLTATSLSKTDFVQRAKTKLASIYGATESFEFIQKLDYTYDYCKKVGVNPEFVVMTAVSENSKLDGYGVHNYFNVSVGNGLSPKDFPYESYEDCLEEFCNHILSYQKEGTSGYNMITQRASQREAAGCNPEGYGPPTSLAGVQSIYSWLGDYHIDGDAGSGGYYYINIPGIIYETQAEIERKCHRVHEYGSPTTIEEQNNYTAWQVRKKLEIRDKIFYSE